MSQDGSSIQDRQKKRVDTMDKGSSGMMMETYTLGDSRMTTELKERCTSCNKMALTHSTWSTMMNTKMRQREN